MSRLAPVFIAAFQIGLAAIHQLQICHCIVIRRTNIDRLVKVLQAFVYQRSILLLQLLADLLRHLHVARAIILHSHAFECFNSIPVRHAPVDAGDDRPGSTC